MVEFTQGLLQSADPKTLNAFFGPSTSDPDSSRAASPTQLDTEDVTGRSESDLEAGIFHPSPKQFSLRISEKLHVFELSLGGSDEFGLDQVS
jgi:hypothetical protein